MSSENEIIKALENEIHLANDIGDVHSMMIQIGLIKDALDLLKRKDAEIKELEAVTGLMKNREYYNKFVKEVFQKETGNELLFPDFDEIYKRYFEQQAEIERLQKLQKPTGAGGFRIENGKVIYYSDMLNGYRHEFKDLDEIVKELNLYMHTDYKNIELITHYKNKAETAKAEAIKELAERLKEGEVYMRVEFPDTNLGTMAYVVLSDDIDNLVKEMAGDDK